MPPLTEQFRRLVGFDAHELAGATVGGEIPLPESLINRVIAQQLATRAAPVKAVRVQPHDGERLTMTIATASRLMPGVRIDARIEQQPEFPRPAILGLRWSVPGMGPLALLAAPALAFFKALPPGIRVEGDRLLIDVGELLWSHGYGELLDFITRLSVITREGAILARFEIRIPPLRAPQDS
jgi:hypothetical protein